MIGAQAGRYIAFDSTGIDFSMTALLAGALVAGLHFWKKNILLSIGMGTVCYMILIQLVFV